MPQLVLLRGLPGSGKTTKAFSLFPTFKKYSADDFFDKLGYFYFRLIPDAHQDCLNKTIEALKAGHSVVVHNTFTQLWELEAYLSIPTDIPGVVVRVVHVTTELSDKDLAERNLHGVEVETIAKMRRRWESFPEEESV